MMHMMGLINMMGFTYVQQNLKGVNAFVAMFLLLFIILFHCGYDHAECKEAQELQGNVKHNKQQNKVYVKLKTAYSEFIVTLQNTIRNSFQLSLT